MSYTSVEKSTLYEGSRVRLELQRFKDDLTDRQIKREVVIHPGSAVILSFLTGGQAPSRNDTIMLIRNRRYSINKQLIELPAGTLDKNEAPMNCAGRELQEETGYLAAKLTPIGSFYPSPGILTEKIYAFAAYDLQKTVSTPEDGEEIELLPVRYIDALEMIRRGEIEDGKTIATLLMYALLFKH